MSKRTRQPVSRKVRFQVFDRDGFACAYCGRTPPAVTLEVDHIVPVVEGGDNDPDNLITSCFDCNRGKGRNPLGTHPGSRDLESERIVILEREQQLTAYNKVRADQRARREDDYRDAWNFWFELWDKPTMQRWEVPWEGQLRSAIEALGVEEVKDAMQIARDSFDYLSSKAPKYFGGVIRNKLAELER